VERARTVLGRYTTVKATASYEAVLADPAVAAVAVATPAATHFDLVRSALEAGKHVLVEKPLTVSASEAEKIVALAKQHGLTLMCDHTYCYTPAVQRIRELVRSGEIGEIQFVDSIRVNLGIVQPDVDVLWDLAPHDISILDFVLPEDVTPVAVAVHASDPVAAGRACLAHLSIWLSTGALAHVHVNWLSPTKIRTTVIGGSRRTIVWDDMNPPARLAIHGYAEDRVPLDVLTPEERRQVLNSWRTGDIRIPALNEREALLTAMTEFAAAIMEGRPPLTDGESGLRVLKVLEAASRSAENGGERIVIGQEGN
jgi:predicted dehydrogenase